jgi:hypothetical protein
MVRILTDFELKMCVGLICRKSNQMDLLPPVKAGISIPTPSLAEFSSSIVISQ